MKKTMVSILALLMVTAALLSGCGETGGRQDGSDNGILPDVDIDMPNGMQPDPVDGEVDDTDGIITEREPDAAADGSVPGNGSGVLPGSAGDAANTADNAKSADNMGNTNAGTAGNAGTQNG